MFFSDLRGAEIFKKISQTKLISFSAWQLRYNRVAVRTEVAVETRLIQSCQALKRNSFIVKCFKYFHKQGNFEKFHLTSSIFLDGSV